MPQMGFKQAKHLSPIRMLWKEIKTESSTAVFQILLPNNILIILENYSILNI
jgi:hypothetical protein